MKAIWKFQLAVSGEQIVQMPQGAQILTAQVQHQTICLWALVDSKQPVTERKIRVIGTGHNIEDPDGLNFIGSVQFPGLVFHVFEKM